MSESDCINKHCENHEELTKTVSEFKGSAKLIAWFVSVLFGTVVLLIISAYASSVNKDETLKQNQEKHEEKIESKLEKVVQEVGCSINEIKEEQEKLRLEQSKLRMEQSKLNGSNETILEYLELLIKKEGIIIKPK